jgi:uncharacterized protein YbcI
MTEQPATIARRPDTAELLASISTATMQAMKRQYGKGPVSAKSYLLDDLLFVVLRGGITRAERTMVDAGRGRSVQRFRQELDNEMAEPLLAVVEHLTGRHVVSCQSQVVFDPDMTIKIFVFDDPTDADGGLPAAAAPLRLVD